jgi:hypothetical protein
VGLAMNISITAKAQGMHEEESVDIQALFGSVS